MESQEKKYWLDDPRVVKGIIRAVFIVCGLLVLADLFYDKHGHFDFEQWFGFHGFFGFVAFVGLVLVSKMMRVFVKREEDYYDR